MQELQDQDAPEASEARRGNGMADLLEANDERRRETKRDGRMVRRPTWFCLADQIAWEKKFSLSL